MSRFFFGFNCVFTARLGNAERHGFLAILFLLLLLLLFFFFFVVVFFLCFCPRYNLGCVHAPALDV